MLGGEAEAATAHLTSVGATGGGHRSAERGRECSCVALLKWIVGCGEPEGVPIPISLNPGLLIALEGEGVEYRGESCCCCCWCRRFPACSREGGVMLSWSPRIRRRREIRLRRNHRPGSSCRAVRMEGARSWGCCRQHRARADACCCRRSHPLRVGGEKKGRKESLRGRVGGVLPLLLHYSWPTRQAQAIRRSGQEGVRSRTSGHGTRFDLQSHSSSMGKGGLWHNQSYECS